MVVVSLRYGFQQRFNVPARAAYEWCTDFGPADGSLFSQKTKRTVQRLTGDTLILADAKSTKGSRQVIHRLVRLDPPSMAWTNTHLDGPHRHSQFWYRIVADGPRTSHLEFEGLHLARARGTLSRNEIARRARLLQQHDSAEWKNFLGPALESDLAA
jgi:hypothetical protein